MNDEQPTEGGFEGLKAEQDRRYENPTLHDIAHILVGVEARLDDIIDLTEQDNIQDNAAQARRDANNERIDKLLNMASQMLTSFFPAQPSQQPAQPLGSFASSPLGGDPFNPFGTPPFVPPPVSPTPNPPTDPRVNNPHGYNPYGVSVRPAPEQYVTVSLSYISELVMVLAKRGS